MERIEERASVHYQPGHSTHTSRTREHSNSRHSVTVSPLKAQVMNNDDDRHDPHDRHSSFHNGARTGTEQPSGIRSDMQNVPGSGDHHSITVHGSGSRSNLSLHVLQQEAVETRKSAIFSIPLACSGPSPTFIYPYYK